MRFRRGVRADGAIPISELVGRAFRAGVIIPFIVLAALFAITVPLTTVSDQSDQGEDFASVLQGIISNRTELFIGKAEEVARLVGTLEDEEEIGDRLDQLVTLDPAMEMALVVDKFGNVEGVMESGLDEVAPDVDTDALVHVRSTSTPYVGTPGFDPTLRKQATVIAVPVLTPTGDPRGMLQIHVNSDWILDALESTNRDLGVNTYVTDDRGLVIAHQDLWRVLASQRMPELRSGLVTGLDGERIIAGVVTVPEWGGRIKVVTTWPAEVILPSVAFGLIPVALLLLAYAVTLRSRQRLVDSVVAPVHELKETIQSYGPENMSVRAGASGVEEVDVVVGVFNETADRMDAMIDSLRESMSAVESSERRFKTVFHSAPVGMALHHMDGAYLETNAVYDDMFGYSEGTELDEILARVSPESRDATLAAFREITSGAVDSVTFEGAFDSASGKRVSAVVKLTLLPKPGDEKDQVLAQVLDVTDLKEAQYRLEETLTAKNQFLAAVSHELRTPLTAVIGLAELLRDPDQSLSSDQRTELINTIVDSGFDVSNMVEDLLTAARQEAGQLNVVSVPVNLIAQTNQALEVIHGEHRISVSGEAPVAEADPGRVRQILRNLITNAIKYGGADIRVELDAVDGMARATVSDDGEGVPEEAAERIFASYERAHGPDSHPGSAGIGLSISRDLARQMGGDLSYCRRDGRTRFELALPVHEKADERPADRAPDLGDELLGVDEELLRSEWERDPEHVV